MRPVIFLDDGGVLNDNAVRGEQWRRMVGEFLAPRLGGSPDAWADANWTVVNSMLEPVAWDERMRTAPDYATFDYAYQRDWLYRMCELVGVAPPPEEESVALAIEASDHIIPRVYSPYPGVVETIKLLHQRGYSLNTASGASSYVMAAYLEGMGVRDCFDRLYGPDLIETFKNGPEFYKRFLMDAGVAPQDALVLDDNPRCVAWAEEAGALAVLVRDTPEASSQARYVISSLAALPRYLEEHYLVGA